MTVAAPQLIDSGGSRRYIFIDLFRSAVIVLMLEGHVFRALLQSHSQRSVFFQLHEFLHGLSAPAFLFGAGLTFVISTRKRWLADHSWNERIPRRIRRLFFVLLLGYALHLPFFSIRKIILDATWSDYLQFSASDVLHCIGLGLLFLYFLLFFFKNAERFYGFVLLSIVSVALLTPLVWDIDFLRHQVPIPIAQLLNGEYGSPFPIFPYIGYLFAGVIVAWEFFEGKKSSNELNFMVKLFFIGSMLIGCGVLFDLLPVQLYPTYNYWYTSPNYFIVRVGSLMILTAIFWSIAQWMNERSPLALTVLGKESLFVYVTHLIVIYGSVVNPNLNLQSLYGQRFTFTESTGIFLILLLIMLILALGWDWLKTRHTSLYRILQLSLGIIFLYLFFTRDF